MFYMLVVYIDRDSVLSQLQLALAKADSEQLARTIAEDGLSEVQKEKTMLELEVKELMSRHKSEMARKDLHVASVSVQKKKSLCDRIIFIYILTICENIDPIFSMKRSDFWTKNPSFYLQLETSVTSLTKERDQLSMDREELAGKNMALNSGEFLKFQT